MLSNVGLWDSKAFWAEAISTACYLVNRSPHTSIDFHIPEEVWSGNPIDYSSLRIFGCPVYAHVNNGKLAPRLSNVCFLDMHLSLKDTAYGVLSLRKSFRVGMSLSMRLLCYLLGRILLFLLLIQVIRRISV